LSVLNRFEEELIGRLRELRPLAVEYHQLEQVARRLGLAVDDERTTPSRRRKSRRKATSTRRTSATAGQSKLIGDASAATSQASATSTRQRPGRSSTSADKRRVGRQRQSRRQQDVLRLIHDQPGVTVRDIATELGVDATNLYRHVRKLQQDGLITKHGTALRPDGR
jgi:Winged helix-turn-helix DNA-binding